jgi:hypothetical protein
MLDCDDVCEAVPAVLVARRNQGQVAFGRQTGRLARPDPHGTGRMNASMISGRLSGISVEW